MLRLITYIDSRERFPTQLCWDEENRLMSFADCENAGFYQYDAGGERTYKLTSDYVSQNIGGHWHTYQVLDNPTLYTSPYMVATPKGYTKHYYAESERVASRIGGGLDSVDMFIQNFEEFVDKPVVEISPLWTEEYHEEPFDEKRHHNLDHLYHAMECTGNVPSVVYECLIILHKYSDFPHHEYEPDCYWYHPDHLGSSSWITFSDGKAVQHLHYLPWGENFVDQRTSSFSSMYTFSAKEKDAETGYSYFGSRYYNSDLSIWLSVDPMADKYPSMSPYTYCANNPVKLTDPDGRWIPGLDDDNNIIVTQEEGDDLNSFRKFMGPAYSDDETCKMYEQLNNGEINLTQTCGGVFQLMTDAINDSYKDPGFENTEDGNYNCWGAAIALTSGIKLQGNGKNDVFGVGIGQPDAFDGRLRRDYEQINPNDASVGITVMRFGKPSESSHGAVYLGKDNSGNEYAFTKNGWHSRPTISTVSSIVSEYGRNCSRSSYFDNIGTTYDGKGYYNHKPPKIKHKR